MTATALSVANVSMSRGTRGAVSELRAGAHLLEQGWHVFWSMSPHCPVDLVAWRPGDVPIKVEVKTLGIFEPSPERRFRSLSIGWPTNDEWDLLLAVAPDQIHEIWSPADYRETLEILRQAYGFPPAPTRTRRGTGPSPDPRTLAQRSGERS